MSKALALIGAVVIAGAAALGAQTYTAPKTPWGHADLQGIYSNDDETGTPMERPGQFEGRSLSDITPDELQKIVKERNEKFVEGVSAPPGPGSISVTGAAGGRAAPWSSRRRTSCRRQRRRAARSTW